MFLAKRDRSAARRFFRTVIGSNGLPHTVTIDKSGANKATLERLNCQLLVNSLGFWLLLFDN